MELIDKTDSFKIREYDLAVPIPDFIWQDKFLGGIMRVLVRQKSETYYNSGTAYDKLLKNGEGTDYALLAGVVALLPGEVLSLSESKELTVQEKKALVNGAIYFKKISKGQTYDYSLLVLLKAFDVPELEPFKEEIYKELIKRFRKENYKDNWIGVVTKSPGFYKQFFNDENISKEERIRVAKKVFPNDAGRQNSSFHFDYIGNKDFPVFIQEVALSSLVNAQGQHKDSLHSKVFEIMKPSDYVSVLKNDEFSMDVRLKLISITSDPVLLSYAAQDGMVPPVICKAIETKLRTMKVQGNDSLVKALRQMRTEKSGKPVHKMRNYRLRNK